MATDTTNGNGNTVPEVAIDAPTPAEASSTESAASKMQKLHEAHAATVEEVLDEEDILHPGSKSAIATGQATPIIDGPLPSASSKKTQQHQPFDINSAELFPELGSGGPGKGKGKGSGPAALPTWGAKMNGSSAVASSVAPAAQQAPRTTLPLMSNDVNEMMSIDIADQMPRAQWKRPLGDLILEIQKSTGARIDASTAGSGMITFITKGKPEAVLKAKTLLRQAICRKTQAKHMIPVSTRKHIIGLKGATIQGITQRTGCRVQIPQVEETEGVDDPFAEEEPMVEISLEGDVDAIRMALLEINQIVGQKTSHINVKLPFTTFPGQFFPFLAGPHNANVTQMEEGKDLKIRIPIYHTSDSSKEFSEPPAPIMISGERSAVQEARAKLEKHAAQLRDEFQSVSISIPKQQHRFLVGDRGKTIGDILLESGCSVVVPPAHVQYNSVLVIGPRDKIGNGVTSVMAKANSMSFDSLDISRAHGAALANDITRQRQHARDLVRYFRKAKEIQRIENELEVQISLPKTEVLYDLNTGVNLEITGKSAENVKKAKTSVINIVNTHPPSRLSYVEIEPLLHRHIIGAKGRNLQKIKDDHSVEVLFADEDDQDAEIVLIYEGSSGTQALAEAGLASAALQAVTELLQKIASEQADLKTKVLNIPAKYHAKIVGPKGTTLNAFTGGSDATVKVTVGAAKLKPGQPALSPAAAAAADDTITIRGPSAEVERVAKKITDFVEETKHNEVLNSYTTSFEFPQKFQKNLVGKGGSNISKYREELGVQIDLEKDTVTIKGIKANVEEAKVRIQRLGRKLEDETVIIVNVAPEYHRTIIGQGGKFVKRLEEKYSVRIQFPKVGQDNSNDAAGEASAPQRVQAPDEIVLRGPSKGVKEAKDEITELIKYEKDHGHSDSITVPARVLPHIIGAGGKVINQIRDDSGAKIDLPPQGSTDAEMVEVRIKGTKDQIAKAKTAILASTKEVENQVVKTLSVDKKFHRALIGPGGQILHSIVVKCGGPSDKSAQARMVRFPHHDVNDSNIKVEGTVDVVDKIIKEFEAIIAAEKDKTTIVVDVPADKHRKLIGREGSVRKEIERTFSVTLDIPRQRQDGGEAATGIKISGSAENVEQAKEHILTLTKDQDSTDVSVPKHLHHSLLDGGALTRTFRNRYNVDVGFSGDVPPRPKGQQGRKRAADSVPLITDEPSESASNYSWEVVDNAAAAGAGEEGGEVTWALRGATEDIAKAAGELKRLIEEEGGKTSTGYLFLPDPSKYRYVVGPGGSQVNSIRKETGCKITIPKEQSDEAIVIKGSRDGVEKAKEIIVGLVHGANGNGGGRGGKGGRANGD
ncbi:hypothetical protein TWF730_011210 [Orbilia blumenaviensis]|uniref:K Homology domain-containing protein n=1 Tax=Orbilia blumenaviensis TaxID=1796055 RepID=A0AAV9UNC4_9PEZI